MTDLHISIRSFELKLKLFEGQLPAGNTAHIPTMKTMRDAPEFHVDINTERYYIKISKLRSKFGQRFADMKNLKYDFTISTTLSLLVLMRYQNSFH